MSSRFRVTVVALAVSATVNASPALRVCADPNNLPYSNSKEQGFENRIASLIARDLRMKVEYTWWAQRRGFVRNTLNAGTCDVIIGVPSSFELTATTRPYYRSSYVFVTRADRKLDIKSFDDPRLRTIRVGVQLIGDDGANSPPAHALSNRGIVTNVVGYPVYGDYSTDAPARRIVDAVAQGDVDVAVVWGPIAGFFMPRTKVKLVAVPVSPAIDLPYLPFVFDMSVGVRRGDEALKEKLEAVLDARRSEIATILRDYGVPRVDRVRTSR
jgi:mxaJ protein